MQLEFEVTAQPKAKKEKQAFEIPFYSHFWDYKQVNYCIICGVIEMRSGGTCKYCQSKFPVKKS